MANGLLDIFNQLKLPANFIPGMPDPSQMAPQAPQQPLLAPQTPASPMAAPIAPPVTMPSDGSGIMGWLNSDAGKSLIGGIGAGLLAKSQNKFDPIVPTTFAAMDQYKKQFAQKALVDQIANNTNYTPQQKAILSYGIQNDPKILEAVSKSMFPSASPSANNPYTLSPGQVRYDAKGNIIVDRSQDVKTQLELNAQAAGYKPGTPEYEQFIKQNAQGAVGRYGNQIQKMEASLRNQIGIDTGLEGAQLDQAVESYRNGQNTLPDGTPLPPMSQTARDYIDGISKAKSTSSLITQGVKANQSEAELKVLDKYAGQGLKPYGTTYMGYSPQQIADSWKKDPDSQIRLGRFIASQALQYESAQLRNRIAMGEPGISATQELMGKSGQIVKTFYPQLSGAARQEAIRYIDEALGEGLKVRNQYGVGASGATGKTDNQSVTPSTNNVNWKIVNGQLVQG